MSLQSLWVLVPLKNLSRGKERLSSVLASAQRRELITAMACDVLESLRDVPLPGQRIVLVSDDEDVAALARQYEVGLYRPAPAATDPLNAALREARGHVVQLGAQHLLVMHADLPLAHPAALRDLLVAHEDLLAGGAPQVTLVSDRAGEGSNCLLSTPPQVIEFCFGADSRARHRHAAQQARARWLEHDGKDESLRCDIDHPDDLDALVGQCQSAENERATHTRRLLRAWLATGSAGWGASRSSDSRPD